VKWLGERGRETMLCMARYDGGIHRPVADDHGHLQVDLPQASQRLVRAGSAGNDEIEQNRVATIPAGQSRPQAAEDLRAISREVRSVSPEANSSMPRAPVEAVGTSLYKSNPHRRFPRLPAIRHTRGSMCIGRW
jgi:hypothetical protein